MSRYQLLPALDDEAHAQLIHDIRTRGVLQPIIIDEHGEIIDGHHRKSIADTYGLPCPALKCPPNLSDAEKRTLALDLNLHRRHLTREQKREVIAESLKADPELSDRQHGERAGADHKTVGSVRGDLEGRGEIPHVDERTDTLGRSQPAPSTPTELPTIPDDVDPETGEILDNEIADEPDALEDDEHEVAAQVLHDVITNDPEIRRLDVQRDVLKAVGDVRRVLITKYPAEDIGEYLDGDTIDHVSWLLSEIGEWLAALRQANSGLRVLTGGKS